VPGTAVFLTSNAEGAPVVLLHQLKHNKALHEQILLLSVVAAEVPEVEEDERVTITRLGEGFHRVVARFGFMETPDLPRVLEICRRMGLRSKKLDTSYFLGHERVLPTGNSPLAYWRKQLFVFMNRNAQSATQYFGLPPNRVVELGAQVQL
jgi:KUP system potassium uptake protein